MLANLSTLQLVKKAETKTLQVCSTTVLLSPKWTEQSIILPSIRPHNWVIITTVTNLKIQDADRNYDISNSESLFKHLNLLPKIYQYIQENLGSTLSEFSGQWDLSLNMNFSFNFPEISTTDYASASHTWNRIPCESQRKWEKRLCSGFVAPEYNKEMAWGEFIPL